MGGRVNAAIDAFLFLPLKESIPNFKMKLFFVLALVVMSFGGLNAAVIPEEMEFSAAKGDILTDDQIARVILEVIAKSEAYGIMDIVTHLPGLRRTPHLPQRFRHLRCH